MALRLRCSGLALVPDHQLDWILLTASFLQGVVAFID